MSKRRPGKTVKLNRLRNPDFRLGKAIPRAWRCRAQGRGVRWQRDRRVGGVTIVSPDHATAWWSQEIACKPGEFYRVEAVVSGELAAKTTEGGAVLRIEPLPASRANGSRHTAPIHGRLNGTIIRAYFHAPPGVHRARLSVGFESAQGELTLETVRLMSILEPDLVSHPLAIPPPPWSHPAPPPVEKAMVCSAAAPNRPIVALLGQLLGADHVACRNGAALDLHDASALLVPDPQPPRGIRSLAGLARLAEERIVIISLGAFAKIAGSAVKVRRIVQDDDPIHARVCHSNFATTGFALHDVFSFAEADGEGCFMQNQFRRTAEFDKLCARHGLHVLLASMCEKEATTDKPIALFKQTSGGALFVIDLEPFEVPSSTMSEAAPAWHVLASMLGRAPSPMGQYTVPDRNPADFCGMIRELGARFEQFVVHDEDVPLEEVQGQLVTIGKEDQSFGLPLRPKPVILVRSGLVSGDMESVYGALTWFKQLLRPPPHACPYADALAGQFRLAWVPCAAEWEFGEGWQRSRRPPVHPMELEIDDAKLAAVIDVVSRPVNAIRVVLAGRRQMAEHYADWLLRLFAELGPGEVFSPSVGEGDHFSNRSAVRWRSVRYRPEVVIAPDVFTDGVHHAALAGGAALVRLEVPGWDADFIAHSISRTSLVATLLEQAIGLQFGLIALNRGRAFAQIDGFTPLAPGEALIVERHAPSLRISGVG